VVEYPASGMEYSKTNVGDYRRREPAPTKWLVSVSILIPLLVFMIYAFVSSQSIMPWVATRDTVGPKNKSSVFDVSWKGAYPAERTAYVYTLMASEPEAEGRYAGVRLGIELIRHTKSTRDIIVMVSHDVPESWRETLRAQSAIVVELPATRPFAESVPVITQQYVRSKTSTSPVRVPIPPGAAMTDDAVSWPHSNNLGKCRVHFAQLHAWGLYDVYDRVVVLEPNYAQQLNLDELFLCGHFCMVYANLNWYNTAVLVLKPSADAHAQFFRDMAKMELQNTRSDDDCRQAYEDYLLQRFFPIEAAPYFRPTEGQQEYPVMRLSTGYAVNPLFWYEKYSWHLARSKEYAKLGGETVFEVPAHGVMWQRGNPWSWFPCIWFNVHWIWQYSRYVMLQEPALPFIIPPLVALIAIVLFIGSPLERLVIYLMGLPRNPAPDYRNDSKKEVLSKLHWSVRLSAFIQMQVIRRIGWTGFGCIVALIGILLPLPLAKSLVPDHTPYYFAWPIFIPLYLTCILGVARIIAIAHIVPLVGTQAWYAASLIKSAQGALRVAATIAVEEAGLGDDSNSKDSPSLVLVSGRHQVLAAKEPLAAEVASGHNLSGNSAVNSKLASPWTECASRMWWWGADNSDSKLLTSTGIMGLLNDQGVLSPVTAAFAARQVTALRRIFFPSFVFYVIYAVMHPDIYPHFVLKIVVLFALLTGLAGYMTRPFIALFRIGWFSQGGGSSKAKTAQASMNDR